jgi:hypothetical protein
MGGTQAHPFVLYPAGLAPPAEPVVGAEELHLLLRRWLATLGHAPFREPFVPAGGLRQTAVH